MRGKLVVIEGSDGAGKATQVNLLKEYLTQNQTPFAVYDFPRYSTFTGGIIKKYLYGEFGSLENYSPYIISTVYALDRLLAAPEIEKELNEGKLVIANRYTYSNMAHQAARLPDLEREKFIKWDEELEYRVNKLPKENLVIFLYVPFTISRGLMDGKSLDLHEKDLTHLRESEKMYLQFAKSFSNWVKVECVQEKQMRTKKDIAQEIVSILKEKKVI